MTPCAEVMFNNRSLVMLGLCGMDICASFAATSGVVMSEEGGGGGGGGMGWLIFILIFVVGNGILYATTGIFLIPLPRK